MRLPVPSSISPRAQKMLQQAPAITARPMDLPALSKRRKDTYDFYAPEGAKAVRELGGSVSEVTLGGVRAQVMAPKVTHDDQIILYFFGGGFVQGSPEEDLAITALLAHDTGRRIYAPYYRLAPEHPCPAALEDALATYRALVVEKGALSITVMGESAGAGLALSLVLNAAQEGLPMPARVVLLSPWSDLSKTGDTLSTLEGCDPSLHYEMTLEGPAKAYAGARDLKDPLVSPLYADFPRTFPRTLITTGTRDLFLSDCARLSTKMRAAGIDCELRVWEGMWHVFEYYLELPEAQASLKEIAAFITA
jgi:monoterpene epsilon-lactone hydrolase